MKLFILLCVVVVAFAEQCGKNQHYNSCGTACPLTCDNYDNPPETCVRMCVPGCHCDAGYVETDDEECVKPKDCPAKSEQVCGRNERYTECGTSCPLTCDNYKNPPKICNLMCNIGCECEEGYVRATRGSDRRCVKPEQCPLDTQVCGPNERYNECGTSCPLTCDNYQNPPKFCNLMCNIGCECEEGYVRATRTSDKLCVRSFQCPQNATVEKTCLGKPETGMCDAYIPSWHYDVKSEKCHRFIYGGCGGNGNRYATEEECMEHCGAVKTKQGVGACDLPAETGVCRGSFPRYYFDRITGQCQEFIYGGCGGNENNFETVEECQKSCDVQASENVCELPAETGLCRGYFPRYHFDKTTGTCKKFIYGGCGGNGNNFESVEECQDECA